MKKLIYIMIILAANLSFAQHKYLQIHETDDSQGVIMYPPGTYFELKDEKGNLVVSQKTIGTRFEIDAPHTLYVFPSWKDGTDEFELVDGRIEMVSTYLYPKNNQVSKGYASNGVTVEKVLSNSSDPEKKNVELIFSNGIKFYYTDGMPTAFLNDEPLDIEGKYIIRSKIGITKLSFNPKTGVVWWVFEPARY